MLMITDGIAIAGFSSREGYVSYLETQGWVLSLDNKWWKGRWNVNGKIVGHNITYKNWLFSLKHDRVNLLKTIREDILSGRVKVKE